MKSMKYLVVFGIAALVLALGACGGDDETTSEQAENSTSEEKNVEESKPAENKPATANGSCSIYCEAVIAAGCTTGPPTVALCSTNCESVLAGDCKAQMQAVISCVGPSPTITCVNGYPKASDCDAETKALSDCKGTANRGVPQDER